MSIDGIFNINKPIGKTSAGVVSLVRRWSNQRRTGHAGTLDPMAVGVLPICMGQATRLSHLITNFPKTYLAEIELGVSTDTYDTEGKITQKADPSPITREQLTELFPSFTGNILQKPPMYSALKHKGKRLYDLARAGTEVERPEREVKISRLELTEWQPPRFTIEVECGRGTYIRSLAHDIGQSLGCGAYLKSLIRISCGPFSIEDSLIPAQVEESFHNGHWQDLLYPMDTVLEQWPAVVVSEENELAVSNGSQIALGSTVNEGRCRAYSLDGRLLALLRALPQEGLWQPEKVFSKQQ